MHLLLKYLLHGGFKADVAKNGVWISMDISGNDIHIYDLQSIVKLFWLEEEKI